MFSRLSLRNETYYVITLIISVFQLIIIQNDKNSDFKMLYFHEGNWMMIMLEQLMSVLHEH